MFLLSLTPERRKRLTDVMTPEQSHCFFCEHAVPTLEKLLVDIHRDPDFEYIRGSESHYIFETALDQFLVNETKLLRYAKRRGCKEEILILIKKDNNYDR